MLKTAVVPSSDKGSWGLLAHLFPLGVILSGCEQILNGRWVVQTVCSLPFSMQFSLVSVLHWVSAVARWQNFPLAYNYLFCFW